MGLIQGESPSQPQPPPLLWVPAEGGQPGAHHGQRLRSRQLGEHRLGCAQGKWHLQAGLGGRSGAPGGLWPPSLAKWWPTPKERPPDLPLSLNLREGKSITYMVLVLQKLDSGLDSIQGAPLYQNPTESV